MKREEKEKEEKREIMKGRKKKEKKPNFRYTKNDFDSSKNLGRSSLRISYSRHVKAASTNAYSPSNPISR